MTEVFTCKLKVDSFFCASHSEELPTGAEEINGIRFCQIKNGFEENFMACDVGKDFIITVSNGRIVDLVEG